MSVKLSELLERSVDALNDFVNASRSEDEATYYAAYREALRAIAPALVTAMKDAVERHIEVDDWNLCPACRFEHILEEAGGDV